MVKQAQNANILFRQAMINVQGSHEWTVTMMAPPKGYALLLSSAEAKSSARNPFQTVMPLKQVENFEPKSPKF